MDHTDSLIHGGNNRSLAQPIEARRLPGPYERTGADWGGWMCKSLTHRRRYRASVGLHHGAKGRQKEESAIPSVLEAPAVLLFLHALLFLFGGTATGLDKHATATRRE